MPDKPDKEVDYQALGIAVVAVIVLGVILLQRISSDAHDHRHTGPNTTGVHTQGYFK